MTGSTEIISRREALEPLRDEWNALLADSAADCIFFTWEWLTTWIDAVYPRARLVIALARDGEGRLIGAAPLYLARMKMLGVLPISALRSIGDQYSGAEYPDLIVRRGYERSASDALLEALRSAEAGWDILWLPKVADWTGATERLMAETPRLWRRKRAAEFACIALPATTDEYWALYTPKARSNLRRDARRLVDEGSAVVDRAGDAAELPGLLEEMFELHRRRWESIGQAGSFARKPALARFYSAFAPLALQRGWLRFWLLRQGGRLIAAQYGYSYNGAYSQLQEGYEPSIESAGNVLRYKSIEALIAEGCREYDFLGGFTEHKRRWRATQRIGSDILIGRCTTKLTVLRYRSIWPTGRYLKQAPLPIGSGA